MEELFAEVILPLPLQDRYTYLIPGHLAGRVKAGIRVLVPFGRRKIYSALVTEITPLSPGDFEIRQIETVLDEDPIIHPVNVELWKWMAEYYMSAQGEVMNTALPSALKPEGRDGSVEERFREKTRTIISLNPELDSPEKIPDILAALKRAPVQQTLFSHFLELTGGKDIRNRETIDRKSLIQETKNGANVLNELIRKGILFSRQETISRLYSETARQGDLNLLNRWQQEAIEEIRLKFMEKQTVLIHGVTASGKTEIYIHLMDEICREGKQVLYLVPEISLTPQIINRLRKAFGNRVGIYHSKMSDSERVEVWNRVLHFTRGEEDGYQIILGARSSVFLPFADLGLIIVDEEHENSYKQHDPAPRYHARDMAVVMGQQHNARVLLGSATPSFETYLNAMSGKYGLVKLLHRHGSANPPEIIIADLQQAYKRRKMISILTPELHSEIGRTLEKGQQVILFQNRRGYSPFLECMNCGWIPACQNCDVSLTIHKKAGRLSCHYCGHHIKLPQLCPRCNSDTIKMRGTGTEKIEDEISRIFPEAKVARMDLDSTRSKTAFEKIIHQLETKKTDILAGTQMVTKGLDIEHVGLAGVINADNLLNYPDFRAHERAFQLMMQVSGRSGRKENQGKVVIQTSQPEHPVIRYLVNNDYEGFFNEHVAERKAFFYPPWFKMIRIALKHKQQATVDSAADFMARMLRELRQAKILGPEYPLIGRVQQLYTKEIWIKFPRQAASVEIRQAVAGAVRETRELPGNSGLIIQIDADPV